jgi:hypothetical protein
VAAGRADPGDPDPDGGFELLEHTAGVGVRARGATLEEVFEHATEGLAEVLGALRPDGPGGPPGPTEVVLAAGQAGPDRTTVTPAGTFVKAVTYHVRLQGRHRRGRDLRAGRPVPGGGPPAPGRGPEGLIRPTASPERVDGDRVGERGDGVCPAVAAARDEEDDR